MPKQHTLKIQIPHGSWLLTSHAGSGEKRLRYSAYLQVAGSSAIVCHAFAFERVGISSGCLVLDSISIPLGPQEPAVKRFIETNNVEAAA